jgi:hypothetical protein
MILNLFLRKVREMDEEVKIIAYCAECNSEITDDIEEYYRDEDGHFFDSAECAMTYYGIHLMEG